MKIKIFLIQFLIILLSQNHSVQGQVNNRAGNIFAWEIGFSSGVSSFVTSVNPNRGAPDKKINYWYPNLNPGIGLSVVRNISPALGVEINWLNTTLTGRWNNKWPAHPLSVGLASPFNFNSGINQFDMLMTFNINQLLLPGDEEDPWHLYIKTGIGISNIRDNKKFYSKSDYQCLGFTLDPGISCSLSQRLKLLIGSTWRFVNTDNLDGVHVVYTDISGNSTEFKSIYEIYNYSYIKISCGLGHYGSNKSKPKLIKSVFNALQK